MIQHFCQLIIYDLEKILENKYIVNQTLDQNDKNESLPGKEILPSNKKQMIEKTKFYLFSFGKSF